MKKQKLPDYIQPDLKPEDLARHLTKARPKKKQAHHGPMKILRTETYKGHDVRIETTYKITVDGKAVNGHLDVTNSGRVHYHPLPNLSVSSAINMVRAIIDSFPDDFPSPRKGQRATGQGKKKISTQKKIPTGKKRMKPGKKMSKRAASS